MSITYDWTAVHNLAVRHFLLREELNRLWQAWLEQADDAELDAAMDTIQDGLKAMGARLRELQEARQ